MSPASRSGCGGAAATATSSPGLPGCRAWDYGRPLIGVIGAVVLVGGAGLLVWGIIGNVDREVALPQQEKRLIRPVARYGIAGRGAAVALVGCFLIAAAFYRNPREAHEVGGMLASSRPVIGCRLFCFWRVFSPPFPPPGGVSAGRFNPRHPQTPPPRPSHHRRTS